MIHKSVDPDEATLMNVTVSSQLMDIERNRFSTFWSRPKNGNKIFLHKYHNWSDIDFTFGIWQQNAWSKSPWHRVPRK